MTKIIKSATDIKNEIKDIFSQSKNERQLYKDIKVYLDNITGKELISKMEIEGIIHQELIKNKYPKSSNYLKLVNSFQGIFIYPNEHDISLQLIAQFFMNFIKIMIPTEAGFGSRSIIIK